VRATAERQAVDRRFDAVSQPELAENFFHMALDGGGADAQVYVAISLLVLAWTTSASTRCSAVVILGGLAQTAILAGYQLRSESQRRGAASRRKRGRSDFS
jgi:hypothetical protein